MEAEEEWEVRSVMTNRAETRRPAAAMRPTYARMESVTDWVVRLAGWGTPVPPAQPDPARKEKEPGPAIQDGSRSCLLPTQPYDFSNPGGVKAAQEKSLTSKTGEALSKAVQSKAGGVDEGAITPPSHEAPSPNKPGADKLPRPCRDLKAELVRLKKVQGPYLDMEAFLSSETEQRGVEPWLVLLDGSRARLPTKEFYHASYVDGFAQRRQFLLAQAPSPATLRAFWYMMLSHRVPLVVVSGPEALKSFPFWPGGAEEDLSWDGGDVYVGRLGPVRSGPGYRLLQLRVRVDGEEGGMELMELPWEKEPRVPMELISVAGRVLALHAHYMAKAEKKAEKAGPDIRKAGRRARRKQPEGGVSAAPPPLAMVCRDGAGRSGALAATAIILERLMVTGEVELVETVKALRLQRFGALHHGVQFLQLHLLFVQHLGLIGKTPRIRVERLERLEAELAHTLRRLQVTPALSLSDPDPALAGLLN